MFEVEVKLRLRDRAALQQALRDAGAVAGPAELQEDTFFAHPMRDFARSDEALRLRRVGFGPDARLELTYKGPKQGGATKARLEQSVALQEDPTPLLASLGFTPAARLAKTRVPYRFDDVHVALDTIVGLGEFVEVEVVSQDRQAAARRVEAALVRLGLQGEARVTQSYLELASQARS